MIKKCPICKKEFKTSHSERICCSKECSSKLKFKPNKFVFQKDYIEMVVKTKNNIIKVKISKCDYEKVSKIKWFARFDGHNYYFDGWNREKRKIEKLHRFIMNCPKNRVVDHINTYDHMDNRRENLKICTQMENMQNQRTRKNSSGHKYIKWHKQSQKWEFANRGKTLIRNNDITKVIRFRDKYFEKENAK